MHELTLPKPRLALLLEHFAAIEDQREPWRVMHPLREALLLVVCAIIANCDDYEDIVDWEKPTSTSCAGFANSILARPARIGCAP